jgi:2,3-bisphosphoglycerate-independent phosphoglycerate mutase
MDRDTRWERIQLAYEAIVDANAPNTATSSVENVVGYVKSLYAEGKSDEFLTPIVVTPEARVEVWN